MNVLMLSPGFPVEQPFFTRGLANLGNHVIGLGDQPQNALPDIAKAALSAYVQVPGFSDEERVLKTVAETASKVPIHSVECTWEPYMVLAARIREMLGLPGMTVEQTVPFRDKEKMKQVLDDHGIRTPKHFSTKTIDGIREAANEIGFPICVINGSFLE